MNTNYSNYTINQFFDNKIPNSPRIATYDMVVQKLLELAPDSTTLEKMKRNFISWWI